MMSSWEDVIPHDLFDRFDFFNYNHAAEVLSQAFPDEFSEIIGVLRKLDILCDDILADGGNESPIPKKFADALEPLGWREIKISGDLLIKTFPRRGLRRGRFDEEPEETSIITNYIDGHNIDYVKNRVACDIEWNSKDQTYDRDLFAFRTYYECGLISVGIIITRSEKLNPVFSELGVMKKYGASTTWIGKLIPRLDSRRHGGCPILAIAIKPEVISDLSIRKEG